MKFRDFGFLALGLITGAIIAYKFTSDHYEKIVSRLEDDFDESIFGDEEGIHVSEIEEDDVQIYEPIKTANNIAKTPLKDYASRLKETGYVGKEEPEKDQNSPYIIRSDQFGLDNEYDLVALAYHSNGILVNEVGEIIVEPSDLIDEEALEQLGDDKADVVYVRNERLKTEFEILFEPEPLEEE